MNAAAYLVLALFLLNFTPQPIHLSDLDESTLCQARSIFNPDPSETMGKFGKAPISNYINAHILCSKRPVSRLRDSVTIAGSKMVWDHYFDSQGRVLKIVSSSLHKDSATFTYDKTGNLVEINDEGKLTRIEYKGKNYTKMSTPDYYYICEIKGLVMYETRYNLANEVVVTVRKEFDTEKRIRQVNTSLKKETGNDYSATCAYDTDGRCIKQTSESANTRKERFYEYNEQGLLVKDSIVVNGKRDYVLTHTYVITRDGKNTTIQQNKLFVGSPPTQPVIYVFDQYGNWIMQNQTPSKGLANVQARRIVYQ